MDLSRRVVRQFISMVPARQAAAAVGVNHKTSLRIYKKIRLSLLDKNQMLANQYINECDPTEDILKYCPGEETIPLFAVATLHQKIVLLPAYIEGMWAKVNFPASVVYADRHSAFNLDFEMFDQRSLSVQAGSCLIKPWLFWPYARDQLRIYHGGVKVNFPLFLHEMAFRFNLSLSGDQEEGIIDDLVACL